MAEVDIDSIALSAAQDIALMWGQDRSQFVAKIQVRIIEAVAPLLRAPAEQAWRVDESIIERLRNALKMHDEDRTTIQSLASSVGDFLREAALAQNAQGDAIHVNAVDDDGRLYVHPTIAKAGDTLYLHTERARVPVGVMRKAVAWETLGADGEWCRITQREFDVLQSAGIGQQRKLCLHEDSAHE